MHFFMGGIGCGLVLPSCLCVSCFGFERSALTNFCALCRVVRINDEELPNLRGKRMIIRSWRVS